MSFTLDKTVNFGLSFEGMEAAIGPSTIESLTVSQNIHQIMPVIEVGFIDHKGLFSKYSVIGDGSKVQIELGNDGPFGTPHAKSTFRIMNIQEVKPTLVGPFIQFTGILDYPKLLRGIPQGMYKGTSSSALQKLAGEIGIKLEADMTNDMMAWLPNNKPFGQFMRQIAQHGYGSAMSAMQLCFGSRGDGQWGMLYKDLIKQVRMGPRRIFTTRSFAEAGQIGVDTHKWSGRSGAQNMNFGYGAAIFQFKPEGIIEQFKDVKALQGAMNFDMNSAMKGALNLTRRAFVPQEAGNTHKHYAEAKNQNERLKATFTSNLTVFTHDFTDLQLLDPVQARITSDEVGNLDTVISGNYIVAARAQHVKGHFYREKLVLMNNGINATPGSNFRVG